MKKKKKHAEYVIGKYIANTKGFGFVEVEGDENDIFIPAKYVNGAMYSDTVMVEIIEERSEGKRREGRIEKITERGITRVVGTFQKSKNYGFVVPDNKRLTEDIFIAKEDCHGAVDGSKVIVELTHYKNTNRSAEGKITEILGHKDDPGIDILSIANSYELSIQFPEKVMNRAAKIQEEVSDADMVGRSDLRNELMITIDGEDSKDLDDAVSLYKDGDDYILGVHIADVSNYVQENSAIDKEAQKRGCSVYLVDRVIPMLPHILCNGICSLNANTDRLALSCIMRMNAEGEITEHQIVESVICVNYRMTYTSVKKILTDRDAEECEKYREVQPMLEMMEQLSSILRKKRMSKGSLDFDFPESKIHVDENGKPTEIYPYDRNVATKMIEDFMLAANETVASHFFWEEIPFLYRVHDTLDPEKMEKLRIFIQNFGYYFKITNDAIHPKELQKLLMQIEGTKEEILISRLTLRSMKQAQYSVMCSGHFGLAMRQYCHFTSPIRRYPDLQIHRIIKDEIRGRLSEDRIQHYAMLLPRIAELSSKNERRANECEMETDKLKKTQYMQERIGNTYEGIISGVTSWGIYVELANTVEGMIRIASMTDDFYRYDESKYEVIGDRFGKVFRLGEPVKIIVNSTDEYTRTVDFLLAEE